MLARPQRLWLPYRWSKRNKPPVIVLRFVLGTQRAIEELEILFSRKERILGCHPNTSHNMILDETAQGLSGCWNKVLVVGIRDVIRLGTCDLIL